jgi:hypothetical protein
MYWKGKKDKKKQNRQFKEHNSVPKLSRLLNTDIREASSKPSPGVQVLDYMLRPEIAPPPNNGGGLILRRLEIKKGKPLVHVS